MNRVSDPVVPPSWSTASRSPSSMYSSNLDRSWSPSASPISCDYGLQLHLWVHSILASKCISKLSRLRPRITSLRSRDIGLQVHLWTRLIMVSNCICEFTWSRPPSAISTLSRSRHPIASLGTPDLGLEVYRQFARSWPPSAFTNSLSHGLQLHLTVHWIAALKCVSIVTRTLPPGTSLSIPNHRVRKGQTFVAVRKESVRKRSSSSRWVGSGGDRIWRGTCP